MFEVQQAAAGEWAVVAGGARALLVAETDPARLRALFEAVRAGFAETLDALVAGGLSRTPSFALLDASTGPVLLAVRGTARAVVADAGRDRDVRASGVSSWVETQLSDATVVTLGAAAGETLPLAEGVVRSPGVVWSAAEQAEDVGATVAAPPRRERETGPVDALPAAESVPLVAGPSVEAFEPAAAPAEERAAEPRRPGAGRCSLLS